MGALRSGSSFLLRLVGWAAGLGGLGLGAAALMSESGELSVLFGVIALGGILIALAGGVLVVLGALLGRGKAKDDGAAISPEQRQLQDSKDFLASQSDTGRD